MNKLHAKVHKHLKLQHHRHTGKLLQHHHTSYRALAVVFVLAGATMAGISLMNHAAADALFSVSGTEPVAIPHAPALIGTPAAGATLRTTGALVTGSCPLVTPQVVVDLEVDGNLAGTAACDSSDDFSVPISLSSGPHTLVARTYTITDGQGPASSPIQITAAPLIPAAASPVTITASSPYSYLGADKLATWTGTISGGQGPYQVRVDWDDGSQDNYTVSAGKQHFIHHYAAIRSYNLLIAATDASGATTSEQFAVAAYTTSQPSRNVALVTTGGRNNPFTTSTTFGLYGLFVSVISVCAIIWLEAKHAARQHLLAVRAH